MCLAPPTAGPAPRRRSPRPWPTASFQTLVGAGDATEAAARIYGDQTPEPASGDARDSDELAELGAYGQVFSNFAKPTGKLGGGVDLVHPYGTIVVFVERQVARVWVEDADGVPLVLERQFKNLAGKLLDEIPAYIAAEGGPLLRGIRVESGPGWNPEEDRPNNGLWQGIELSIDWDSGRGVAPVRQCHDHRGRDAHRRRAALKKGDQRQLQGRLLRHGSPVASPLPAQALHRRRARNYRYAKRSGERGSGRKFRGSYTERKLKLFGHTRPLELSGEGKRLALYQRNIAATRDKVTCASPGNSTFAPSGARSTWRTRSARSRRGNWRPCRGFSCNSSSGSWPAGGHRGGRFAGLRTARGGLNPPPTGSLGVLAVAIRAPDPEPNPWADATPLTRSISTRLARLISCCGGSVLSDTN